MLFLFTKYRSLTLLSFESFHIGLVREMFTPRQSTVNEVTRGIRRSIPMMLCGLLSNLLWLDSRPQSIMGIERLIPRVTSLTVDCRGVNISLTKPIWKLSNDKSVRLRYFVKRNSMLLLYCCDHHYDLCFTIPSLPFLNICMGHAVILAC